MPLELTVSERDTVSVSEIDDVIVLLRVGVGHGVASELADLVIDVDEHPETDRVLIVEKVDMVVWEFLIVTELLIEAVLETLTVFVCEDVTVDDSHLVRVGDTETESECVFVVVIVPVGVKVTVGVQESLDDELLLCKAETLRRLLGVALEHTVIEGLSKLVDDIVRELIIDGDSKTLWVVAAVFERLVAMLPVEHALIEPVRDTDEQALADLVIVSLFVPLFETVEHTDTDGELDELGVIV